MVNVAISVYLKDEEFVEYMKDKKTINAAARNYVKGVCGDIKHKWKIGILNTDIDYMTTKTISKIGVLPAIPMSGEEIGRRAVVILTKDDSVPEEDYNAED